MPKVGGMDFADSVFRETSAGPDGTCAGFMANHPHSQMKFGHFTFVSIICYPNIDSPWIDHKWGI